MVPDLLSASLLRFLAHDRSSSAVRISAIRSCISTHLPRRCSGFSIPSDLFSYRFPPTGLPVDQQRRASPGFPSFFSSFALPLPSRWRFTTPTVLVRQKGRASPHAPSFLSLLPLLPALSLPGEAGLPPLSLSLFLPPYLPKK